MGVSNYFMPRTTPRAQPTIKSVFQSKEIIEKRGLAISEWMTDASIPFNEVNLVFFSVED